MRTRLHRQSSWASLVVAVVVLAVGSSDSDAVFAPRDAGAAVMLEASLAEMRASSSVIAMGTPREARSVWESEPRANSGDRIVTYTRVEFDHVLVSTGKAPTETWVRTLGGIVGDVGQRVEGEAMLILGKRSLIFLQARGDGTHAVVNMSQGLFRFQRDIAGIERLVPAEGGMIIGTGEAATSVRARLAGKTEADATQLIAETRPAHVH